MSDSREIKAAILESINESKELRALLESIPERVEKTVEGFVPVLTGETKASIETGYRRTPYKRLGTRRIKLGDVHSTSDPARTAAIEYGRGEDAEHGATPEFAPFRKAAAVWDDLDI